MRNVLLASALIAIAFAPAPVSAQYSPNYGGNCERPLVPWRGAHLPCDGYGPRQQHRGGQVQGHRGHVGGARTFGRTETYVVPGPPVAVYRGTVAVPVGTLLVPRNGGPSIYIPR